MNNTFIESIIVAASEVISATLVAATQNIPLIGITGLIPAGVAVAATVANAELNELKAKSAESLEKLIDSCMIQVNIPDKDRGWCKEQALDILANNPLVASNLLNDTDYNNTYANEYSPALGGEEKEYMVSLLSCAVEALSVALRNSDEYKEGVEILLQKHEAQIQDIEHRVEVLEGQNNLPDEKNHIKLLIDPVIIEDRLTINTDTIKILKQIYREFVLEGRNMVSVDIQMSITNIKEIAKHRLKHLAEYPSHFYFGDLVNGPEDVAIDVLSQNILMGYKQEKEWIINGLKYMFADKVTEQHIVGQQYGSTRYKDVNDYFTDENGLRIRYFPVYAWIDIIEGMLLNLLCSDKRIYYKNSDRYQLIGVWRIYQEEYVVPFKSGISIDSEKIQDMDFYWDANYVCDLNMVEIVKNILPDFYYTLGNRYNMEYFDKIIEDRRIMNIFTYNVGLRD